MASKKEDTKAVPARGPPRFGRCAQAAPLPANVVIPDKPMAPIVQSFQGKKLPEVAQKAAVKTSAAASASASASASAAKVVVPAIAPPSKKLAFAKRTPNLSERKEDISPENEQKLNAIRIPSPFYRPTLPQEYRRKQQEITSKSPYKTSTVVYTPQSRRSFYHFINHRLPIERKAEA